MNLKFEVLSKGHVKEDFDCGEEALNIYVKHFAKQDMERGLSRTFVVRNGDNFNIIGFYTLSSGSILLEEIPDTYKKKLPQYPVPVARLARLAVNKSFQRQGYGELLLVDALYRISSASQNIGIYGIIIDAKHERAKYFYEKYGFESVSSNPLLLFMPLINLMTKFES